MTKFKVGDKISLKPTPPFYVDCPTEEIFNKVLAKMKSLGFHDPGREWGQGEWSILDVDECDSVTGYIYQWKNISDAGKSKHIPYQKFLGEEPKTITDDSGWLPFTTLGPSTHTIPTRIAPIKSSFKEKSMSLLKRLLDPELKLIEKYCMDSDGDLDFANSMVQEALLKTDGFKKNLVELCQAKAKEEKKK